MIEIKKVSFQHENAEKPSLKNVSLTIAEGECVLLCGESGSGKTTVTRLINGLIPHFYEGKMEGCAMVNGLNVTEAELYDTARIVGSVFQNPRSQFFCVDTTSELAFGCENMGMPEDEILSRVDEAARKLNIEKLLGRSIFELSGGEKQKISCASVSALRPEVMVLDEPTSNLDVHAIEELKQTLLGWKAEGKTIVIAEHRLSWLRDLCDRVICMKDGQVAFDLSMQAFAQYSTEQLHQMGLRSLRDEKMAPVQNSVPETETMQLQNFCFSYDGTPVLNIPHLSLPLDGIIALVGPNGAGKSTFFRLLAVRDEWFSDDLRRLDDDNVYRKLQGHWIIEMSEMIATANAKSIEEIKSFLSRQKEVYKIPYETHPADRPRQCVFGGTSNALDFLPLDRSGNRRFLPVLVNPEQAEVHILEDEAASRAYISQLWAEAMALYRAGRWKLTFSPELVRYLKDHQRDFMPEDTKAGMILAYLDRCTGDAVCSKQLYREALNHPFDEPKQWEIREINEIMNQCVTGWSYFSNPRMFPQYGRQKGWERENATTDTGNEDEKIPDGFVPVTEQMEIPF